MKVGNGNKMTKTMKGKRKGVVVRADGKTQDMTLGEVHYVPQSQYTLYSITKTMNAGFCVSGSNKEGLILTKSDFSLAFDRKIKAGKGLFWR